MFKKKQSIKSIDDFINARFNNGFISYTGSTGNLLKEMPKNPFISSALNSMQQSFYAINWSLYKEVDGDKQEIKNNIIYRTIKHPNKLMDTNDFLYYCYLYWTIHGEFLVRKIKLFNKYELWVYEPSEYQIEYDKNILLGISKIRIGTELFTGDDIDQFRYKKIPNLYSKFHGMNRITSLVVLHDYYCLISKWNNNLLLKSGKREIMITMSDPPTGMTKEKIKDDVERSSGSSGVGKPLIISGLDETAKVHNLDFSPRDFDYMTAINEIRNIIASVLNVPDLLIGGKDNAKYNNVLEAKKSLYSDNIIPACDQLKECLNALFNDVLGDEVFIDYDYSNVQVLKIDYTNLINSLNTSQIHTINEKRSLLKLDAIEGGDEILVTGMPSLLKDVLAGIEEEEEGDTTSIEDLEGAKDE